MIVAIDGPAGSGKGTITEIVSKELNLINISSGGAYRCVALLAIENNIEIWQKEKILDVLNSSTIEFKNDVANIVSQISSIKEVRFKLNEIFRQCAKGKNVIMEGRDIGTYVFPNADVKLYLDASEEIRAKRRVRQNKEQGIETNYEEVLENLRFRDKNDREKEVGALKQAEDAVYINSDNMTPQQEADEVIKVIKSKVKGL